MYKPCLYFSGNGHPRFIRFRSLYLHNFLNSPTFSECRGVREVRRCWVNFQCRGVLLIWIIVGQGPIALAVGAGGGCLDIFSLIYHFSFLSPSLWETARYRLKYCLKGPLSPKQPKKKKKKKNQRVSQILREVNQNTFINNCHASNIFREIYQIY